MIQISSGCQGIPELFGKASAYTMLKAKKKAWAVLPFLGRSLSDDPTPKKVETRWEFLEKMEPEDHPK